MKIAITGTPGSGKTTVAEKLAEVTSLDYVAINDIAREKNCIVKHDEERDSDVVDVEKLQEETKGMDNCILDGHLSHFLENDKIFVLRCKPAELKSRLIEKGWNDEKVSENVDAEITGVIEGEVRNGNEKVYSINTSDKNEEEVVEIIKKILDSGGGEDYKDPFDWIEEEEVDV